MCIKKSSYSTENYLQYNVKREKTGRNIHVSVRQWAHIDALITWLTINGNSCCLRLNSPPTVGT